MTSPASAASSRRPAARGGFTLVETLLTVAILMVVITLSLAAINKARRTAAMNRVRADFQALSVALEQYKNDYRSYPMRGKFNDKSVLAKALVGPGDAGDDGADGPGFRIPGPGGGMMKIRQPMFPAEKTKFLPPDESRTGTTKGNWEVVDAYGYVGERTHSDQDVYRWSGVVQYYPKRNDVAGSVGRTTIGPAPWDNFARFEQTDGIIPTATLRFVLGDHDLNGTFNNGESLTHSGGFVLASPGADGVFTDVTGASDVAARRKLINSSDDIYNIVQ